jgi:hypothetical protein
MRVGHDLVGKTVGPGPISSRGRTLQVTESLPQALPCVFSQRHISSFLASLQ